MSILLSNITESTGPRALIVAPLPFSCGFLFGSGVHHGSSQYGVPGSDLLFSILSFDLPEQILQIAVWIGPIVHEMVCQVFNHSPEEARVRPQMFGVQDVGEISRDAHAKQPK